jgi:hypothetical protein
LNHCSERGDHPRRRLEVEDRDVVFPIAAQFGVEHADDGVVAASRVIDDGREEFDFGADRDRVDVADQTGRDFHFDVLDVAAFGVQLAVGVRGRVEVECGLHLVGVRAGLDVGGAVGVCNRAVEAGETREETDTGRPGRRGGDGR